MEDTCLTAAEIAEITEKTRQWILDRASKEAWHFINETGRGGTRRKYPLISLPGDIQKAWAGKNPEMALGLLPALAPEAANAVLDRELGFGTFADAIGKDPFSYWKTETAISLKDIRDPRVSKILDIIWEAEKIPRDWTRGRRKWIESVALRHGCSFQAVYRWLRKYEKSGIAGICHRKSTKGNPRAWTPDALDFWIGLCLKKEHRKIDLHSLYIDALVLEAHRRGWRIGSYASALQWFRKKATPQLLAIRDGGMRALDNVLPPILRDYSDLDPFEILVGDQHRFDFWVVDDDTGEVFRPEAYLWQDLRTRIIYGAAVDRRYDSRLMGLALRIGISIYGAFVSIYTDHGKPEESRYIAGILGDMKKLKLEWVKTLDVPQDLLDVDPEDVQPAVMEPGTHRKAIVKNAKAKMIEGTYKEIERIMRSTLRLPGSVKRLTDDMHKQEVDHKEALALAKSGRLLLFSEFVLAVYRACDHYNRVKSHRGVLREWTWKPRPKEVTPFDCLKACCKAGWRPRFLSDATVDMIFLHRERRTVHLGRIQFQGDFYQHDALLPLHGKRIDIRYNPLSGDCVLCFEGDELICVAEPMTYSSMKDQDLARGKIMEKRERRRRFAEQYRQISSGIPDLRQYSQVSRIEKAAALVDGAVKKRAAERLEFFRQLSPEELEAGVAELEAIQHQPAPRKPLPERPGYFLTDCDRHLWCVKYESLGGQLSDEDREWVEQYESSMTPSERERWRFEREYGSAAS